jgi:hypothetical protein
VSAPGVVAVPAEDRIALPDVMWAVVDRGLSKSADELLALFSYETQARQWATGLTRATVVAVRLQGATP